VSGAEWVIDPTFKPGGESANTNQNADETPFQLPLDRIDVIESVIIANGTRIPFETHLVSTPGRPYEFSARFVTEGEPLELSGSFDPVLTQIQATAKSDGIDASSLVSVLALFWPQPAIVAEGAVSLDGWFSWSPRLSSFNATLEPASIWVSFPGPTPANLGWHAGVLHVEGNVRGSNAAVTINMDELAFESESAELEMDGVAGRIALSEAFPPVTDGLQHLKIDRLKKGDAIFDDGTIDFSIEQPTVLLIQKTAWQWLDGTLSADGIRFDPSTESFEMTLSAQGIQLKHLLELLAEDHARGEGRFDMRLPVKVTNGRIAFGEGNITGVGGGTIEIFDADAVADSLGIPADARDVNVKERIIEALRDFEYDTLMGTMAPTPDRGLLTTLHVNGHGRTGARQALNFELRFNRLEDAILLYLGLSSRFFPN
jgi:hypothetical protein